MKKLALMVTAVLAMAVMASMTATQAQEAVKVTEEMMTFKFETGETSSRSSRRKPKDQRAPGHYPIKSTMEMQERTVKVIKLDNGIVEAWVVPVWGARLIRAIDKKTGQDYFKWWGFHTKDVLGWDKPGGVKASFPFFEHGTHMSQPATYRIVKNEDGSATVAMQMRFTQYQGKEAMTRYGRFADEPMFIMVTVRPGSSIVEWHQRKENPTPMPRSERMWNDALFPTVFSEKTDKEMSEKELKRKQRNGRPAYHRKRSLETTQYIYPVRWVADHGPTTVHSSPHWSNPDNWNVSHFAVDAPFGFVGVWTKPNDISYLRINDPETAPAAKMYTCDWDAFMEHWGGVGYVFEKPGALLPAYRPVEFTHRFYIAIGLGGAADFANDDIALTFNEKSFKMVATRNGQAVIKDGTGSVVAEGAIGPHAVLSGDFDGTRLIVELDGKPVLDQALPLDRPKPARGEAIPADIKKLYDEIVASHGFEGETVAAHDQGKPSAVVGVKSNPRVAYRFGNFDKALELLGDKHDAESDYLRALIAWEKGEDVNFGKADWHADYHRALWALKQGEKSRAIKYARQYIAEEPTAWRPRLALAYWEADAATVKAMLKENPASPEALMVLTLLGDKNAEGELQKMLGNDRETKSDVAAFKAQIMKGEWVHPRRYTGMNK